MAFKRYGGEFQSRGSGNTNVAAIGLVSLVAFSCIAIYTGNPIYLVFGFLVLFFLTVISTLVSGGATSGLRRKLYLEHLKNARTSMANGEMREALKMLDLAGRYGAFTEEQVLQYQSLKKNTDISD